MKEKLDEFLASFKKISLWNLVPFVVWPLLFFVAFFIMYNRYMSLYMQNVEYKGTNTTNEISYTFHNYLDQVDDSLKTTVTATEYMINDNASDESILKYITYESERLGIVSDTGARGIFGVFRGSFLHGLGWNPENYDPTEREWYKEAVKNNGDYVFVGPYFNKRTDEYVVTQVKLLDDNESVIAFAIDYNTFKRMTTEQVKSDGARVVLAMNSDGVVLSNSENDEIGVNYAESDDPLKREIAKLVMDNTDEETYTIREGNGIKNSYIITKKHVLYNIYVVTVTNVDTEIHDLRKTAFAFGTIFVLGMVIIFILNYVSLTKDLESKERTENLNSISNIYVTMHRIDMANDTFEQLTCIDYRARQLMGEEASSASEMMIKIIPEMVESRSKDLMIEFTDLSTLNDRMKSYDTITAEFLNYEHIWHRARFIVIDRDANKNIMHVLFATEVIDEEKRARDRFQYLAETDQLTGINNRGSGETKIRDLLLKNVGGMFILFDVDKFKFVNDNFGHDVGDEVLIGIATLMRHTFREKDIVMRLGGDEFAAYMPGVYREESGRQILDRFISNVHSMNIESLGDHKIDISIGAAFYYPADTFSFEELYKRADSGTYTSKKFKGSEVTFFKRKDDFRVEEEGDLDV